MRIVKLAQVGQARLAAGEGWGEGLRSIQKSYALTRIARAIRPLPTGEVRKVAVRALRQRLKDCQFFIGAGGLSQQALLLFGRKREIASVQLVFAECGRECAESGVVVQLPE